MVASAVLAVTVSLTACGKKNTNQVVSTATPAAIFSTSLAFRGYSTFAWGFNGNGQLGGGDNGVISPSYTPIGVTRITGMPAITGVAVGGSHCLAFRNLSTVWSWGNNYSSQLGTGLVNGANNTTATSAPSQVVKADNSLLTRVTAVSAGWNHSLALTSDGTVWSWGGNYSGQLGDAAAGGAISNNRSYAAQVQTSPPTPTTPAVFLTGATQIAAGGSHSLALMSNYSSAATGKVTNTVLAWGLNNYGQIGNNPTPSTTSYNTTPVPVFKIVSNSISPLTNIQAIAAGGSHSLALDGDGNVWAWGANFLGQLGIDPADTNPHPYAVKVWDAGLKLHKVTRIAAGLDHTLLLLDDNGNTMMSCGSNFFGQLGNGLELKNAAPNPTFSAVVTSDPKDSMHTIIWSGITTIMAIGNHNLASDGTRLWAWGENTYGQLGNGSNPDGTPMKDSSIPVPVIGFK